MTALLFLPVVVAVHELGHAVAGISFGYQVRPMIGWRGVAVGVGRTGEDVPAGRAAIVAAAGPVFSLLFTVCAFLLGDLLVAGMSLELVVLNVLPFPHSDGRNVWRAIRGVR